MTVFSLSSMALHTMNRLARKSAGESVSAATARDAPADLYWEAKRAVTEMLGWRG